MKKILQMALLLVFVFSISMVGGPVSEAQGAVVQNQRVVTTKTALCTATNSNCKAAQYLDKGSVVTVLGVKGDYYKVTTQNNQTGYIKKSCTQACTTNSNGTAITKCSPGNNGQTNSDCKPSNNCSPSISTPSNQCNPNNNGTSNNNSQTNPVPETPSSVDNSTAMQQEMLKYINADRSKAGLSPLQLDTALSDGAYVKSKDMADNNYFSHNSPTYGSPFNMMQSMGITYRYAGENIARHTSVQGAHQMLMASPTHYENIMSSNFNKIGLGFFQKGTSIYITQWFTN